MNPTVGILAIFRNEAQVIEEWVLHHREEGISQFVLIDDASQDNGAEIALQLGCSVVHADVRHQQPKMYHRFLPMMVTEWVLIIDLDEFVYARQSSWTIPQYLCELSPTADAVVLPWKTFGCAGLLQQPASIIEACRRSEAPGAKVRNIKTLTRRAVLCSPNNSFSQHISEVRGNVVVSVGRGKGLQPRPTLDLPFYFELFPNQTQPHAIHLNHYQTMSHEYFRRVKMLRGSPNQPENPRTEEYYRQVSQGADAWLDDELYRKRGETFTRVLPSIVRMWPQNVVRTSIGHLNVTSTMRVPHLGLSCVPARYDPRG